MHRSRWGLLLLVFVMASSSAAEFGPSGPGAAQCSGFIQLIDQGVPVANFVHWAQGYLASINATHFQHLPLDGDSVQTWLTEHCREFPAKPFGSAVHSAIIYLTK